MNSHSPSFFYSNAICNKFGFLRFQDSSPISVLVFLGFIASVQYEHIPIFYFFLAVIKKFTNKPSPPLINHVYIY